MIDHKSILDYKSMLLSTRQYGKKKTADESCSLYYCYPNNLRNSATITTFRFLYCNFMNTLKVLNKIIGQIFLFCFSECPENCFECEYVKKNDRAECTWCITSDVNRTIDDEGGCAGTSFYFLAL